MKKILIMYPYYYPGYRSGGPQQTIQNIVNEFGKMADIYIYTQNHDFGMEKPYENVVSNQWVRVGDANVMYVSSKEYCGKGLLSLYKEFSTIYSCVLFAKNTIAILILHFLYKERGKEIYIAPMGVFSEGAMRSKSVKKKTFLKVFSCTGIFKHIIWSFTSEIEHKEAIDQIGEKQISKYILAEDLPRKIDFDKQIECIKKKIFEEGRLKIIFLSRISPKKNLAFCLDILKDLHNIVIVFDIYGVKEDEKYWSLCEDKINSLPGNVKVQYCGEVEPMNVIEVFSEYDVFLFPTKGENFGHVIYESLAAGCIPIISDKTPWLDLDANDSGRVISLEDIDGFQRALKEYMSLNVLERKKRKVLSVEYARRKRADILSNSGYTSVIV